MTQAKYKKLVADLEAEYIKLIPSYFEPESIMEIANHKGSGDATYHYFRGNECIGIAIEERAYFNVTGERLQWTPEQEALIIKVQKRTNKAFKQIATNP